MNMTLFEELMKNAMTKAARSFSMMLKKEVVAERIEVSSGEAYNGYAKDRKVVLLVTSLIGNLTGKSFFILSEGDVKNIMHSVNQASGMMGDHLMEEVLKELDNILSASVISELANELDAEIYGDVPELHLIDSKSVEGYICSGQLSGTHLYVRYRFLLPDKRDFAPQFIWKVSDRILETKNLS